VCTHHVCLQVKRVEDYGVFVEFQANDRSFTALLPADEAKVGDWGAAMGSKLTVQRKQRTLLCGAAVGLWGQFEERGSSCFSAACNPKNMHMRRPSLAKREMLVSSTLMGSSFHSQCHLLYCARGCIETDRCNCTNHATQTPASLSSHSLRTPNCPHVSFRPRPPQL